MTECETTWDAALGIRTTGRDETHADAYHHPYEPTPYCVLERLAGSGFFQKGDVLLDYGCGKGRVGFFLSGPRPKPSGLNMMPTFSMMPKKTGAPPCPAQSRTLF